MRYFSSIIVFLAVAALILVAINAPLPATLQVGFPVLSRSGNTTGYANFTGSLTGTGIPCLDGSGNLTVSACAGGGGLSPATAQAGTPWNCSPSSASGTTYTCTLTPTLTAYTANMYILFVPDVTNTGSATLNIDGLGAKTIEKFSTPSLAGAGSLVNVVANDLVAGVPYTLRGHPNAGSINAWIVEQPLNQVPTTNQNVRTIGASFGSFQSGATALSAAATACVPVFFSGTITAVHLIGNVSGSVTVDVQTVLHSSWTGTAAVSSITSSDTPALSSAAAFTDTTLTGWTTALAANTDVCFVLTSPTTVAGVAISLDIAAN